MADRTRQRPAAGGPGEAHDTDMGTSDRFEDTPPGCRPDDVCCDAHAARAYRSEGTVPVDRQWYRWGRTYRPTYIKAGPVIPRPKLPEVA